MSIDLGEARIVVVAAGEEAAVVAEDDVRLLAAHHLDVLLLLQLPRAVPVEVFRLIINPRLDFPTLVDTISAEKGMEWCLKYIQSNNGINSGWILSMMKRIVSFIVLDDMYYLTV